MLKGKEEGADPQTSFTEGEGYGGGNPGPGKGTRAPATKKKGSDFGSKGRGGKGRDGKNQAAAQIAKFQQEQQYL